MREDRERIKSSGFTLVEVLIAVAILSIISIPIMQAFVSTAQVNGEARRRLAANTIAETLMESCKSLSLTRVAQQFDTANGSSTGITVITDSDGSAFKGRANEYKSDFSGTTKSYSSSSGLASQSKYTFILFNVTSGNGKYCALIQYELDTSGRNHGADGTVGTKLNEIGVKYLKYYKVTIYVYWTHVSDLTSFKGYVNTSNLAENAYAVIEGSVADKIQ